MAGDFLPRGDTEFTAWVQAFQTELTTNLGSLGLVAADLTPITTASANWTNAFHEHTIAQATARSKREAKDISRAELTAAVRALVARLQASPDVDDTERAALGITVKDSTPTPSSLPSMRPEASVDTSHRLRHTISFRNDGGNGTARPKGTRGCEIWVKVGDPAPLDASELVFLGTATRSPYTVEFKSNDVGQMAHYMLRWVNTRGEAGPWSETESATVPG